MKNLGSRIAAIVCGLVAGMFSWPNLHAAAPVVRADPIVEAVEKTLRRETTLPVDRRDDLKAVLARHPGASSARWQAGYVRVGEAWCAFDRIGSESSVLRRYREERSKSNVTGAGQLRLADWCAEQGLPDQERAHLFAALPHVPADDLPDILERLGFVSVNGRWMTRGELQDWREAGQRARLALKTWGARLTRLAALPEASPRRRDAGRELLQGGNESEILPAIEYTLCGRDEPAAMLAIELIRQIGSPEGSLALAKQAVFSKWKSVRHAAAVALKSRRFEDFVPPLIGLLATPSQEQFSGLQLVPLLFRDPAGGASRGQFVLLSSYIVARETEDQFQVAVLRTIDYRLNQPLQNLTFSLSHPLSPQGTLVGNNALQRAQNDVQRYSDSELHERQKFVQTVNARTEELNSRITDVLASISGQASSSDPSTWWNWWAAYADVAQSGGKKVNVVEEEDTKGDRAASFQEGVPREELPAFTPRGRASCFAAGTLVTTETGRRPVETIRIGDRVLAKHSESGELAFKPVLHTTVGRAKELLRLRIGDDTITATGGHRFWVSGEGRVKARDLKPQMLIHTVTGNAPVWSVEKGPTEPTYNLVVDEFHTYFVGDAGLLVQNLPLPRPTDCVVPGLPRRKLAAAP
jgi:hypothetical protein